MFSKRHYMAVAGILRALKPDSDKDGKLSFWFEVVGAFTNFFTVDNPKFDRQKFLVATGAK